MVSQTAKESISPEPSLLPQEDDDLLRTISKTSSSGRRMSFQLTSSMYPIKVDKACSPKLIIEVDDDGSESFKENTKIETGASLCFTQKVTEQRSKSNSFFKVKAKPVAQTPKTASVNSLETSSVGIRKDPN